MQIKYPWLFELGDNSWVGERAWIDNFAPVVIGHDVCISQGAYLFTGNHDYKDATMPRFFAPIAVCDGAWVGARAIVCPGTTVAEGVVLTVGSIASGDLEPWMIYRGAPAAPVKRRTIERWRGQPLP